jgi:nitroreductase
MIAMASHDMEFFDVIRRRRSVRAFSEQAVAPALLDKVLESANAAPSAGNLQSYEIYVVTGPNREALSRAACDQYFLAGAPVSLVFCAHPARAEPRYGRRGVSLYATQDATIACTFAMLAATASGLATVWVGAFRSEEVCHVIGAPEGVQPVAILPIGCPAEMPSPPERRALDELVHHVPAG